ncbi:MAG: hypothetical protein SGILL_006061, partial [Bacillariaceae sp.]
MLTMRMSRHRLAELSFPPLPIGERTRGSSLEADKAPQREDVPIPAVALTKRRFPVRPSWELGMVDTSGFSTFILPNVSNPNEAGTSCLQPSLSSSKQQPEDETH